MKLYRGRYGRGRLYSDTLGWKVPSGYRQIYSRE